MSGVRAGFDPTGNVGVDRVALAVQESFSWIFRRQLEADFGIDAHIETTDDKGWPTGRLIALQIKSGPSFFDEKTDMGYVFRGDNRHLNYWLSHSLPVLLVLYEPSTHSIYWAHVTKANVTPTPTAWKIVVPFAQKLDSSHRPALESLANEQPELQAFRSLLADAPLMKRLADEPGSLQLQVHAKISTMWPRAEITLAEGDKNLVQWYVPWVSPEDVTEYLQNFLPWADLAEEDDDGGVWDNLRDDFDNEYGTFEGGEFVINVHSFKDYTEDYRGLDGRGVQMLHAEKKCEKYFGLTEKIVLNDLGEAFLRVHAHVTGE